MSFDETIKTPCYVIDTAKVSERYNDLKLEIERRGRKDVIAYSVKANYDARIIETLKELGALFEVCSEYEYKMMLQRGISAERIIVNGCTSTDNILKWEKHSIVILDSLEQLKFWYSQKNTTQIGIRLNLDYFTKDRRFKNKHSRFGIDIHTEEIRSLLEGKSVRKKIKCIQCHLSGNNREPSIYGDIIKEVSAVIDQYDLHEIEYIDVGGGFKVGTGQWDFSDYLEVIDNQCNLLGLKAKIIYEPGNSIVNSAVCYYTKIIAEKRINGRAIKIVDGSSLQLPRTNLQMLLHEIKRKDNDSECLDQVIYGSTCKESDIIIKLENEPELQIGDTLVFKNVGAYSVNEVNTLILGRPNIVSKSRADIIYIGNHKFSKVCEYSECYQKSKPNNYSSINNSIAAIQKGIYLFATASGEVIYVGLAYDRVISKRVKQHFRDNDTGSLRCKLSKSSYSLEELNNSILYVCPLEISKQDMFFEEAYLIGYYRPKYNFL